jgi:hypothetical protein
MDPGGELVLELREAGMTVDLVNDHIIVAPRDRITDQLRGRVRYRRKEIIQQLRLEQGIRTMAARWSYSNYELAIVLAGAQSDPEGWMAWTERDERDFGGCLTPKDFATRYARLRGLS